jgi:LuxR family maltose regulon positive regulatory protein
LSTGSLDDANRWIADSGLDIDGEFNYHYELNHITLARILVARILQNALEADPDQTLYLLERLLASTDEKGWLHQKIQVLILQALVLSATGNHEDATQALLFALSIAKPGRYVRTFIREGKIMRKLLQRIAKQMKDSDYVEELIKSFPTVPSSQPLGLVEPLSAREREVMSLLATSLSVPEIAEEMILSPNTVRSHIKNIYSKLEVNRRMDAIQKAKELRLL